jgi:hypothetical protein
VPATLRGMFNSMVVGAVYMKVSVGHSVLLRDLLK